MEPTISYSITPDEDLVQHQVLGHWERIIKETDTEVTIFITNLN